MPRPKHAPAHSHPPSLHPIGSYELSIYMKTLAADMNNYFGFWAYDSDRVPIKTGEYNNPYFKTGEDKVNIWQYLNAFLLPASSGRPGMSQRKGQRPQQYVLHATAVCFKFLGPLV